MAIPPSPRRDLGCRLPGCGGPRTGVCINNLSFEECPDVVRVDAVATPEEPGGAGAEVTGPATGMVATGGARSLGAGACDALLRDRGGFMIGIVAGPEVGKTTMIAAIYELVHRGRMASFRFAGSETLRGYEERCHLARTACEAADPDTPRTRSGEQFSFLHLRLRTDRGYREVLFSDRSGEHFEKALRRPPEFSRFAELRRADAVLLLVDLERLLVAPHVPTTHVRRSFLAMAQNGMLAGKPLVLVGTKADLLREEADLDRARSLLAGLTEDLVRRGHGVGVTWTVVSSRARRGSNVAGVGLEALLVDLLREPEPPGFELGTAAPVRPSEVDALMRHMGGVA